MSHSKEKRNRLLLLICGPATEAIQSLLSYYLTHQNKTLQQFIDDNQHDIYHLYKNDRCCICPAINQTKRKHNRKPPFQKEQIEKLFDTIYNAPRKSNHTSRNSTDVCCCFAKPINVNDLDITFLKSFFINLCQDFLWDKFLVIHHSGSFQKFLHDKQHDIFHLCHTRFVCCQCKNGKVKLPYSNLQKTDFMKLYDYKQQNCTMVDTCAYCANPSLVHYNDLKVKEPKVFMELTNCLCPLRLSIDEIGKIRNKLVHGTNTMQEDYDDLWKTLKSCLLEIGTITNSECLTADGLDKLWSKPLDMENIDQKLKDIIENHDVASKILHAKMDNICATVADMKADINPSLQALKDDMRELKEKIHLNEKFMNKVPLIRQMTTLQYIQPLDYASSCSYPIRQQRDIGPVVSYKDEDIIQQQLLANCQSIGLRFTDHITPRNGNCFFEAVSCQLKQNGLIERSARKLRRQVIEYLKQHKSFEDQDSMVDLESFLLVPFEEWANTMKREGEFADHVVIIGTAKMLEHDIFIVTSSPQTNIDNCIKYITGKEDFNGVPILLAHFWEIHYQSLESINESKELNGTEDINTNVCMPFKLEGQHDILRQIDDETCNLLDAAKSIIGAENLNDYNVTGAKIELTLESRKVKQRQIELQKNGKDGPLETRKFEDLKNSDLDAFSVTDEEHTSDSDDDSEGDSFICFWCKMEFTKLLVFVSHQKTCSIKKSKKKKRKDTERGDGRDKPVQTKLVITKKTDIPKNWKDIVKKKQKREKDSLDIDGMTVELIHDGSLVVWAKLDNSVVKNGTTFVNTMDNFMLNLFKKCPVETEKETSISIKVEILDSTEDDDEDETDTFKCGRCKDIHRSLASFTAHKRQCLRTRQKAHKLKKPNCKKKEILKRDSFNKIGDHPCPTLVDDNTEWVSKSCTSSITSGYESESGADTEHDMIQQNLYNFNNKKLYRDTKTCNTMATSGVSSDEETSEAVSDSNNCVGIVSDDAEFYDAENTEEESWQMADKEIYEIARRIGHEWFGIGLRLGYDHSLLETLESMYVTEHARRNFKMIACWCKIVSNLQLNVRQHLAFHLSESSRQDIADDIGVYYKDVHTPKIVYNHVKKLSLDRSPIPFGHAKDAVLVQQFKFDINMTTGAQNLTQVLQRNDRESFDTTNIKSETWKQEKSDKSGECSAFACDELKAAVPNTKDRIWENEISTLVNNLFLKKFFPSKITLQDVKSIKSPDLSVTERTLPWLMLNKLFMLNYHAREEDLCLFYERNDERPVSEPDDSDKDLFEDTGICSKINPMDLFYVTFLACDLMLKQEIIGKLFTCRLAIPILYRDSSHQLNFTKWSLRQILINKRKDDKSFQTDALHHETKRISFVRIGRQTISKSKLINEIMYDQNHPTFFNRDCPLGTTERRTTDGIVEASWFIPSGKPNDLFGELIMFLNLRGDCSNFDEELDILCKLSHVLLVHTNVENLADQANRDILLRMHQHKVKIVYALESSDMQNTKLIKILKNYKHTMEKFKQRIKFFDLNSLQQSRSASDITKELRKIIIEMISEMEGSSLKDEMNLITIADENISTTLTEGNRMANTVIDSLECSENIQKQIVLPLQGPIWVELCSALKSMYRSKSDKERQQLQSEMKTLRSRQNTICKKQMHPFMTKFLKHLEKSKANGVDMFCFLAWIQTYLDEKSRDVLPQLILNYQNSWMEMKSAKEKNSKQTYETLARIVEMRESELVAASFGLEHLIREIGQIYEAMTLTKSRLTRKVYKKAHQYPAFVSQFLQNGYPFEIMDGDTAMVPIPWVKAVFQQLKKDIGDKKLLAISVLGIQSSGKSTLLNAMFGLKFPVSAGRCTRGVVLQLVKVEKGVLPFSHVLVIDSEGLRAPELADKKHAHDNELATFVLGLGNVTIINIKGENTTEMEDVLQIAVHAFLRLKMANGRLKLSQTCIFVHQNLPTFDATTAMTHGRQKMMDNLDRMTCEAAIHEGLADITTFNQVIAIDPQSHIWFFSDLWYGDPPMAPINLEYSGKVAEVKQHILFDIAAKKKTFLSVSETMNRIEDLWNGILSDDFVFSFRNSLEIKAYHTLESKFHKLIWNIDRKMHEFIRSTVRVKLARCETNDQLEKEVIDLISDLRKQLIENKTVCLEQCNNFIDTCSLREIMEQWRQSKIIQLNECVTELVCKGIRDIQKYKTQIAAELVRTKKRKAHQTELQEKAVPLAAQCKEVYLTISILWKNFNQMWNKWIEALEEENIPEDKPIGAKIEEILYERFPYYRPFLLKEIQLANSYYKRGLFESMTMLKFSFSSSHLEDGDISISPNFKMRRRSETMNCKHQAVVIINVIFAKIDCYISYITCEDIPFEKSFATTVFMILIDAVNDHNKGIDELTDFQFTAVLIVKLAVHIANYIAKVFMELDKRYQEKHSTKAQMEDYKSLVWHQFTDTVKNENDGMKMTSILVSTVEKLVENEIEKCLPTEVVQMIIDECFSTKYSLMLAIMKDLAEKGDFLSFQWYITDAETFSRYWIKKFTSERIFGDSDSQNSEYSRIINKMIDNYTSMIGQCLELSTATTIKRKKQHDISLWTSLFEKNLGIHLPVPYNIFYFFKDINYLDCTFVCNHFKSQINKMANDIKETFLKKSKQGILWKGENPYRSIFNKLWGCTERCPFCRETCQKTSKHHPNEEHTCVQHRPLGLKGVRQVETNLMSWETCNYMVYSNHRFYCSVSDKKCQKSAQCKGSERKKDRHSYRDYGILIPDWEIEPSPLMDTSSYWMWFVYTYRKDLENAFGYIIPDVVETWKGISKDQAIRSLRCRGSVALES